MRLIDRILPVGPRSVLFGAHQFIIHPIFLAIAWCKLYGFPRDVRYWVAFFVHDIGYLALWCRNMDGPEGEKHPEIGANIMCFLFGIEWGNFVLYHSRYYAKAMCAPTSRLAIADKLAIAITPAWLYLPLARLSGEIREYRKEAAERAERSDNLTPEEKWALINGSDKEWYAGLQSYMRRYVEAHKGGEADTWTKARASKEVSL